MNRVFKMLDRKRLALIIFLVVLEAAGFLLLPTLASEILNRSAMGGSTSEVYLIGGIMFAINVATIIIGYYSVRLTAEESQGIGNQLRKNLFNKVLSFSQEELTGFNTSTLITRTTNDVMFIQLIVMFVLRLLIMSPIVVVVAFVFATMREARLAWVFAVGIPLIILIMYFILKKVNPIFRSLQGKTDRLNKVFREGLTGIRVIRAFNTTGYEADRFDEANLDFRDTSIRANTFMAFMMPALMLSIGVTNVLVFLHGTQLISIDMMEIGNLIAFVQYVFQILMSVLQVAIIFFMLPRAEVAAERIFEVLDVDVAIQDPETPIAIPSDQVKLSFKDVSFGFPGAERPAVSGINFEAEAGDTIAIIGGTGAGKTTIANLIPRLYEVTTGAVEINGVDVRQVTQHNLRQRIGFAAQKAVLFSGTIRSNLATGKPGATDEEMWEALEIAQGDFVKELPDGLDSRVEQGGNNFSGGQKQRLSIARAIISQPDIYVFDDTFSALDFKTDAKLREALKPATKDAITVIIAQRINTVIGADRILVIENGEIVGAGTHDELLASNAVYRDIYDSQVKGEDA
ncbi:ABC transporter ATP-binding protein [Aerococcaceae bacterium DSM 111176]|nr:ABC transporter ATP-binding protein [Aerococcaceae bacterium DSM 111176]